MNAKYRYLTRYTLSIAIIAPLFALAFPWVDQGGLPAIVLAFVVMAATLEVLNQVFARIHRLRK